MADFTDEDDAILSDLGVEIEQKKTINRTPREERIIAGFEEVQRFVEEHDRTPSLGDANDIFEKIYATRLDQLRRLDDCLELLEPLDNQGLLNNGAESANGEAEGLDDDALLEQLGIEGGDTPITNLRHVRPMAEKKAAESIANREKCHDFEKFKSLFLDVQNDLKAGVRKTRTFVKDAGFLKSEIKRGQFFVLNGQVAYVENIGKPFSAPNGESDARLRVIYSNGTESDLLLRSLQRALYKDEAGRRITDPVAGPLFGDQVGSSDLASGTIYVLRSKSNHPIVKKNQELIHKLGVTSGKVEKRIAMAQRDPTFLMAEVEIVATYKLYNMNGQKFESLIHRVFAEAQIEIQVPDRFDNLVVPKEWFLVPLDAIDEAVGRILKGDISDFYYDPGLARLVSQ